LLKQCRAGNTAAVARVRSQLPRLGLHIRLADVQHALARERGFANWAELKQSREPLEQLLAAVRGGAFQKVLEVWREHPDLAEDSIHAACVLGDSEAAALQLAEDPELATQSRAGWPPILYACASPLHKLSARHSAGIIQCVTILLEHGVDPNTSTIVEGKTPEIRLSALYRAITAEHGALVLFLQRRGATPAGVAEALPIETPQKESLMNGYRKIFSDPAYKERFAARMREMRELQSRLDEAPPAAWQQIIQPPPMPVESVKILIDAGLNVNKVSGVLAETALHRMVVSGDEASVREMLAHAADPNLPRADGKTPYVLAMRSGRTSVVELCEAHGAARNSIRPIDRLLGACVRADVDEVRRVVTAFPDVVRQMDADDENEIIKLAACTDAKVVRTVIESGFDLTRTGAGGSTALHIAAWQGHLQPVRTLLDFHVPVNALDVTFGSSPLTWAAHGSKYCRNADDDYSAVVQAVFDAGGTWIDRWESSPEAIASPGIAALFRRLNSN